MERSEPSLVPEWLRSTGGGTGGGSSSSSHHFASSQADGPVLALPKMNRSSKSIANSDALHSSLLDRSSSSNSRRSSSSNGSIKHDKNSYARSYSSFSRSQRDRDRGLTIADNWDSEYSDPLRSMITGRTDDALSLRRSQSMISRRQGEVPQRKISTDLRNGSHNNNHDNGNGTHSSGSSQKVSFERDFPMLGSDERPKTPDITRVSSPGLSRGIQILSIGNSPLVGSEGWTSALAEVPSSTGSNGVGSPPVLQPSAAAASASSSTSGAASTVSGLNMAEALVQPLARSHNIPQPSVQMRDELAIAQSKKLIPMTPALPKTLALNPSDKLKPKPGGRSSEAAVAPKNGVQQQLSQLQLGNQSARGPNVRADGPKSPSSGKLLLLKPGRENGVSKDVQIQTTSANNWVTNGQSNGAPSLASAPLKNPNNPKLSPSERKTSAFGLNPGPVADKRSSLAQAQSRNDFFNLMRKKSMGNTSGAAAVSADMVDKSDREVKEVPNAPPPVTAIETGNEVKCNGEPGVVGESFFHSGDSDNSPFNEEERIFLLSLGWDECADEGGLTEEEINAFYQRVTKMDLRPTSKPLCRILNPKKWPHCARSTEQSASASRTEA